MTTMTIVEFLKFFLILAFVFAAIATLAIIGAAVVKLAFCYLAGCRS